MVKILKWAVIMVFLCMPFFYAQAQGGFIEESVWSNVNPTTGTASDFIITKDGTKVYGEIIRTFDYTDYDKVEFTFQGSTKTFLPDDLQAFGLINGRFFMSKKLTESSELEFVQILFSGKLQLDYRKGNYYLDNGKEIQQLRSYYEPASDADSDKKRLIKLYVYTLKVNTAGNCGLELNGLIERARLDEHDFIRILTQYHTCEQLQYKLHVEKIPVARISPVVAFGISSDFNYANAVPVNMNFSFSSSLGYRAFAGIRFHDFRSSPKSTFDLRVGYLASSATFDFSISNPQGKISGTQEFKEKSFALPISYSYSIIKRRDKELYIGLVAAVWFNSMKNNFASLNYDYLFDNEEDTKIELEFFSNRKFSVVPGIKVGSNIRISDKTRLFAEVQGDIFNNYYSIDKAALPVFRVNRTSVSLHVGIEL